MNKQDVIDILKRTGNGLSLEDAAEEIVSLRQPQAARLTEEDVWQEWNKASTPSAFRDAIIDRLTAASAQVTREEIAKVLSAFCGNDFYGFDDYACADAIMSLLAERGLVKEG